MPSRRIGSTLRRTLVRTDDRLRRELVAEVSDIMNEVYYLLRSNVSSWTHKPRFRVLVRVTPVRIDANITPEGRHAAIFVYVDQGTEPHLIRAKTPGGKLKFRTGYSAKTAAPARAQVGSGRATGGWVATEEVQHPGTEAREFMQTYMDQVDRTYRRRIENAMRRAASRA